MDRIEWIALMGLALALAAGCDDEQGGDTEACGALTEVFDFESGEQGFIHTATDTGFDDPWELGTPYYQDCHSGENCWVTNLWDDYGNCEAGGVYSPTIDLSACAGSEQTIELRFWHIYRLEPDYDGTFYDGALVQLSGDGGTTWTDVSPSPGYTGLIEGNYSECAGTAEIDHRDAWAGIIPGDTWTEVTVAVDDTFRTEDFRFSFLFGTDRGETDEGWYIDDVELRVE